MILLESAYLLIEACLTVLEFALLLMRDTEWSTRKRVVCKEVKCCFTYPTISAIGVSHYTPRERYELLPGPLSLLGFHE